MVKTVMLGRGSRVVSGRKSQYTTMWAGEKNWKSVRLKGVGSQMASSQTSRVGSGWAREAAEEAYMIFCTNRSGEFVDGDESTRTRDALGVDGAFERGVSNRR